MSGIENENLEQHFDRKYQSDGDPWGYKSSWYEKRKYAVTLALLLRPEYERCWEPACSIGELTALLATRCHSIDASDISTAAIDIARKRLVDTVRANVEVAALPYQPPQAPYDLIVMSEILYYLDDLQRAKTIDLALSSLAPGGELVVVHWRHHPDDAWISGESANEALRRSLSSIWVLTHTDEHFVIDIFRNDS